jgi:hypothetical protein
MYRSQDSDNGSTAVQAAPVPEAQPINQAELTELQRAMASVGRAGYLLRKPRLHPSRGFYFSLFVPAIDQHRVGRTVVPTSLS